MIQRIQSVFLLLVSICMISVLYFPIWEKTNPETGEKIVVDAFSTFNAANPDAAISNNVYIAIFAGISAVIAFFSIFRYRNRLQQIKLGLLNSLLMSLLVGAYFYTIHQAKSAGFDKFDENYNVGFFLPLVALIFNLLANRFIRKDEELVRSVDRLR
ncbi:MAG: DUF4293 domain-containing protein [Cytophagaceae bacterium]